jgi:hypothetical protein
MGCRNSQPHRHPVSPTGNVFLIPFFGLIPSVSVTHVKATLKAGHWVGRLPQPLGRETRDGTRLVKQVEEARFIALTSGNTIHGRAAGPSEFLRTPESGTSLGTRSGGNSPTGIPRRSALACWAARHAKHPTSPTGRRSGSFFPRSAAVRISTSWEVTAAKIASIFVFPRD